jgi:putative MATE family efflux protein
MQVLAGPLVRALAGGSTEVAAEAATWLRIAALGAPGLLLAAAGNGWMRGVQETRRPVVYVIGANGLSAILCPILVYPIGLGLHGSAIANVCAQTIAGVLFVRALAVEKVPRRPRPSVIAAQLVVGRDLLVRGAAFQASFLSATAVAARFGTASVAAHQIGVQLWFFAAMVLDAVAIAAQSLTGAALGAGSADAARRLGRRIGYAGLVCGAAFAVLALAGTTVVPGWFTDDPAVRDAARTVWPWLVALMIPGGVLFALDGVLIGAGDVRFMRNLTIVAAVGFFLPAIWLAYAFDLGLAGVWSGLFLFIAARLVGMLLRMRSGRWAVVGAVR